MTIIKTADNNKYWQQCGEMETLTCCGKKYKIVQLLLKAMWWSLKVLTQNYHLTSNSTGWYIPKKTEIFRVKIYTQMFIAALYLVIKNGNNTNMPHLKNE